MSSPKKRRKDRRTTYKTIDEAWKAEAEGNVALADKLSQRALAQGFVNPRVWLERGAMLEAHGDTEGAARAYERARSIAPGYREAEEGIERLRGAPEPSAVEPTFDGVPLDARAAGIDWDPIARALEKRGAARVPRLIDDDERTKLLALWSDASRFEHAVAVDDERGKVEYRFFERPLPPLVEELRSSIYVPLVNIVNDWQRRLGRAAYPPSHEAFVARCARHGQRRTTPIMLRYPPGGFNAFHRDVVGDVVFPLQLAITLGPGSSDDGGGGELLLLDERPGKKRIVRVASSPGDGVVFATRERLVPIAGLLGLQPVLHGVSIVRRERFAIGIPFHQHRGD